MNSMPAMGNAFNAIPPEAVLVTLSLIVGLQTGVPVIVRNAGTSMIVVPLDIAIRVAASAGSISTPSNETLSAAEIGEITPATDPNASFAPDETVKLETATGPDHSNVPASTRSVSG